MPDCGQIGFEFTKLLPRRHTVVTIAIHLRGETTQHPVPESFGTQLKEKQSL